MSTDKWLPVVGYEDIYEVSDHGQVRRPGRVGYRGKVIPARVLIPDPAKSGHLRVRLSRNSSARHSFVHRLVLAAFVGPLPAGMEACHNDGNPRNNHVHNLRWDTKSANARDRRQHGNDKNARKTHCPKGHEYTPDNTYYSGVARHRHCKVCFLAWGHSNREKINATRRKRYARKKLAA